MATIRRRMGHILRPASISEAKFHRFRCLLSHQLRGVHTPRELTSFGRHHSVASFPVLPAFAPPWLDMLERRVGSSDHAHGCAAYADCLISRSIASTSVFDSGATLDPKRATTVPSRAIRNFSKFH
jgi:hypothetical protein